MMSSPELQLAEFEKRYAETKDGIFAMRAYVLARDHNIDVPEWVSQWLDRAAKGILRSDKDEDIAAALEVTDASFTRE